MIAEILEVLIPGGAALRAQLQRQAARIAVNRTVAGVHFPVDSAAGRILGVTLAEYFLCRCGAPLAAGSPALVATQMRSFDGPAYAAGQDFDWSATVNAAAPTLALRARTGVATAPAATPVLAGWLYPLASSEW